MKKNFILLFVLLLSFAGAFAGVQPAEAAGYDSSFIRGADISTLADMEKAGAKYYENGMQKDPLQILKDNGANYVRLRIWNDPRDAAGNTYGAGTNDLKTTIDLAKRAKAKGMKVLLDFHYSDFWVDPGKQNLPKSWQGLSFEQLNTKVYDYTFSVLAEMKKQNVYPDMVQIGNELNSGMLWPHGKSWGEGGGEFDRLAAFLKSGIKAVRDTEPKDTTLMLHLAEGGNYETFKWWFDEITARNVEYDTIGISYYPYWHGTLDDLETNMNNISKRYGKDVIVVETAYGHTTGNADAKENAFGQEEAVTAGYAATPKGQHDFMQDLVTSIQQVPNKKGTGFFYWEPLWNNGKVSWATPAGMNYLGVTDETGNEWDNQAIFDFNGNALDAVKIFGTPNTGAQMNYVKNPSFESGGSTGTPADWTKWTASGTTGTAVKTEADALDGNYKLTFWDTKAYDASVYQQLNGLPNGTYKLSAWLKAGGTHITSEIYAKNGSTQVKQTIPGAAADWTKVTLDNVKVTDGKIEIGIYNKAQANAWLNVDHIKLQKK